MLSLSSLRVGQVSQPLVIASLLPRFVTQAWHAWLLVLAWVSLAQLNCYSLFLSSFSSNVIGPGALP